MRLKVLLPLALSMILVLAVVVAIGVYTATGDLSPRQVSTTASILAIVCVLIPLAVVAGALSFAILIVPYGTGKLPQWTAALLRPLRSLIQSTNQFLQRAAGIAAEPVIFVERQLARIVAFLDGLLHFFRATDADSPTDVPDE
jgi:hypothetical protein